VTSSNVIEKETADALNHKHADFPLGATLAEMSALPILLA
jgi:hypothetical protein